MVNENDKHDEHIIPDADSEMLEEDIELEGDTQAILKHLRTELKECAREKKVLQEEVQRIKADYLNAKRRQQELSAEEKERQINDFVLSLLPLCDSFDMAMQNQEQWEAVDKNWRIGVEGIYSQLKSILDQYGVVRDYPLNEPFLADKHDAVGVENSDSHDSDTIITVVQAGYIRNETIIRPAKVIISK